jgi:signal transduction histidine kinase
MSLSLRSQFLIPIVAMLLLVCLAVTGLSWRFASNTTRLATEARLRNLLQLCSVSKFPLTQPVLDQIGDFSRCKIKVVEQIAVTNRLFSSSQSDGTYDGLAIPLDRTEDPSGLQPSGLQSGNFLLALSDPQERFERTTQAFWLPMATGILSTLACSAIALGIANRMVRRLEVLKTQVNRIAMGEYATVEVDPRARDAIASLTHSINSMSQQLEKAMEEISNSERSRLIHMLANGMAHQLRNSLAGAVLLLQTVIKRNPQNAPHEIQMGLQQIQLAEESIRRLLTISCHGRTGNDQALSVQQIHEQIDGYTRSSADHHCIDLKMVCSGEDLPRRITKGTSVISALLNLVLNAMEAASQQVTKAGEPNASQSQQGMVQCRYVWDSQCGLHRWSVRDNGPGPEPSIKAKMFEPFVTSKPEGIGLGLPTTALLAKELGGDLQWHRDGQWTEFVFTIRDS